MAKLSSYYNRIKKWFPHKQPRVTNPTLTETKVKSSDRDVTECEHWHWVSQSFPIPISINIPPGFQYDPDKEFRLLFSIDAHSLFLHRHSMKVETPLPPGSVTNNMLNCLVEIDRVELSGCLNIAIRMQSFITKEDIKPKNASEINYSSTTILSESQSYPVQTILGYMCPDSVCSEQPKYKLSLLINDPFILLPDGRKVYVFTKSSANNSAIVFTSPLNPEFIHAIDGTHNQVVFIPASLNLLFYQKVIQTFYFYDAAYTNALPMDDTTITIAVK